MSIIYPLPRNIQGLMANMINSHTPTVFSSQLEQDCLTPTSWAKMDIKSITAENFEEIVKSYSLLVYKWLSQRGIHPKYRRTMCLRFWQLAWKRHANFDGNKSNIATWLESSIFLSSLRNNGRSHKRECALTDPLLREADTDASYSLEIWEDICDRGLQSLPDIQQPPSAHDELYLNEVLSEVRVGDRLLIEDLLGGMSETELANKLGVSRWTVHQKIAALRERYQQRRKGKKYNDHTTLYWKTYFSTSIQNGLPVPAHLRYQYCV